MSGLVISLIRYCIVVYGNSTTHSVTRIQKLLNFCARVVSGRKKREHVRDVLSELNWLPAEDLVMYRTLCLLKAILTYEQPADLASHFRTAMSVRQRSTRQDDHLVLPRIRTESGRRMFIYRGARAYNALPPSVRDGRTAAFKNALRIHMGQARQMQV